MDSNSCLPQRHFDWVYQASMSSVSMQHCYYCHSQIVSLFAEALSLCQSQLRASNYCLKYSCQVWRGCDQSKTFELAVKSFDHYYWAIPVSFASHLFQRGTLWCQSFCGLWSLLLGLQSADRASSYPSSIVSWGSNELKGNRLSAWVYWDRLACSHESPFHWCPWFPRLRSVRLISSSWVMVSISCSQLSHCGRYHKCQLCDFCHYSRCLLPLGHHRDL